MFDRSNPIASQIELVTSLQIEVDEKFQRCTKAVPDEDTLSAARRAGGHVVTLWGQRVAAFKTSAGRTWTAYTGWMV